MYNQNWQKVKSEYRKNDFFLWAVILPLTVYSPYFIMNTIPAGSRFPGKSGTAAGLFMDQNLKKSLTI